MPIFGLLGMKASKWLEVYTQLNRKTWQLEISPSSKLDMS